MGEHRERPIGHRRELSAVALALLLVVAAVASVFLEEGVPVTHAVIPTAGGSPITEDPRTCDYLADLVERSGPRVELAVHGYDHRPATDFFGRSEFGGRPADEQREVILGGGPTAISPRPGSGGGR